MILKIEPDQPLTMSLKYRNAYEKKVNGSVQFKYTLENGDILYLPPLAHAEIQSLNPAAREPFTLLKSIGHGNQAVWKVERIQPSAPVESELPARPDVRFESPNKNYTAPKSITNGKAPVSVMPAAAPTLSTRQSSAIVRQLIAAVDACKVTQDYAKSQGMTFEPNADIICRLAITSGIQSFKEGVY